MNRMIRLTLVAASVAVLPATASEVGILVDKQIGQSITIPVSVGLDTKLNSVSPTGFGIRGAYTLLDLKVIELGVAATYHPKAEADLEGGLGPVTIHGGKAGGEYMAIGAQVDWKFLVNLHVGLDMRREKISNDAIDWTVNGIGSSRLAEAGDTTITRPWLKAGIGFSIPLPVVSPFVRLEAAYALKNYSVPSALYNADDVRKAMAPKYQIALYGGIRF